MNADRRPPPGITPEGFFTEWLPAAIERLGPRGGEMRVRVVLTGPDGGGWDLQLTGGRLSSGPLDETRPPLITLQLAVADWRALVVGEEGPVSLTPPAASPTDLLFVDEASQQLLAAMTGTFRFEVRGYNGRTWQLTAVLGEGGAVDPPDAMIATDAESYAAILARTLSAPEAYFAGKITITGDAGRGMQVGLALLPKL